MGAAHALSLTDRGSYFSLFFILNREFKLYEAYSYQQHQIKALFQIFAERSPTIHAAGHDFDAHFPHSPRHDGDHNHRDHHGGHDHDHDHYHRNDHQAPGLIFGGSTSTSSSTSRSGSSSSTSETSFPTSRVDSNYLETTTLEQDDLDLGLTGGKDRQCMPFQIEFCRQLPYNFTTFPNAMGHRNVIEANRDIERFK